MKFSRYLSNRPRLRAALLLHVIWVPLFVLGMPLWIHARSTPGPLTPATHPVEAGLGATYRVADLEWMDTERSRKVPARLFWPTVARSQAVPLVVFSPGIGSSRDGYTHLGRYWAEHGIASLHLQHVGSDRSLWLGSPFSLVSRFRDAASDAEAIARAGDARFALDQLLSSPLGPRIAPDRITAAGHSYGANTSLLEAGATVIRNGEVLNLRDPRISAAILISAPPFYGESDLRPILASIGIPTLHITTEDDVIRIPGFNSGVTDREDIFEATGSGHKVLAIYNEGSHNVFTDRRYFDSRQVAEGVKADTQALSLAFLEQVGGGSPALTTWPTRHAGLIAKYVVVTRD